LQQGQGERRCLAGTGLRDAEYIPAGKQRRNRTRLDGRGGGIACGREGTHDRLGEAELKK
jgi:hypothetical protein